MVYSCYARGVHLIALYYMITLKKEESIIFDRGFTDAIKFFTACSIALGHYAGHV